MKKGKGNVPSPLSGFRFIGSADRWLIFRKDSNGFTTIKLVESSLKSVPFKANYWLVYNVEEKRFTRNLEMEKAYKYLSFAVMTDILKIIEQ